MDEALCSKATISQRSNQGLIYYGILPRMFHQVMVFLSKNALNAAYELPELPEYQRKMSPEDEVGETIQRIESLRMTRHEART